MKILTKEEEQENYNETLKGGLLGGGIGLVGGVLGVYAAGARYPAFRSLTLPLRAFLVTSSGTFGAIVTADHYSRAYETSRHPDAGFEDVSARARAEAAARQTPYERFMALGKEYRYPIIGGSWVLSMVVALALTGRNPYLSAQQKLVQARVYAQGLTVAVLIATAVFEVGDRNKEEGRWETVKILDPDDPEHKHLIEKKVHKERYEGEDQWRDMVEAEEQKRRAREEAIQEEERKEQAAGKFKQKEKGHQEKEKSEKKPEKKGKGGQKDDKSKKDE